MAVTPRPTVPSRRSLRSIFRRVCGALLVAAVGATGGCKGRHHEAPRGPPLTASVAAQPPAPPLDVPEPVLPTPTRITTPSDAAYADGGAPRGYERVAVWDLVPSGEGAAVLLLDASRTMVLPIFVAGTEALTIRLDLDGKPRERPLTHDLLASIVHGLGARPVKAQIDDVRDDTYFGSVFLRQGERVIELDARPSDAIAIALGSGAPLYVSKAVMLTSGVPREALERARRLPTPPTSRTPISL
jgi:uncharacterized protein